MTNSIIVENRISTIKKYLKILERYKNYSIEEIKENIDLRGAIERYLYLAVQSTIDLAETVIAQKGFRKPTTLRENFDILQEENIIPIKLTEDLIKMVGFRNIITHSYEKVNYDIVYDILQNRLENIFEFLEIIKEKIK